MNSQEVGSPTKARRKTIGWLHYQRKPGKERTAKMSPPGVKKHLKYWPYKGDPNLIVSDCEATYVLGYYKQQKSTSNQWCLTAGCGYQQREIA